MNPTLVMFRDAPQVEGVYYGDAIYIEPFLPYAR